MYKGLYDSFSHWFHDGKGQVWFYSDPHFNDDEMKYLRKDYIGDEEQIKRINAKIGKWDTLVILGDIGDKKFVKRLRGYKVLVTGNHDEGASHYKRYEHIVTRKEIEEKNLDLSFYENKNPKYPIYEKINDPLLGEYYYYDNKLFDEVYEGALIISEKLILSHEPLDFAYALNIHGHDHARWTYQDDMHWNVCAEMINYTPVCLKHIIESGRLKNIPNIHRETIDQATLRKEEREKKNV